MLPCELGKTLLIWTEEMLFLMQIQTFLSKSASYATKCLHILESYMTSRGAAATAQGGGSEPNLCHLGARGTS